MRDYMSDVISMIDLNQNLPLNQIIYEGLRSAIIHGVIPMGERINEKHYAQALNVSRTPIREALHRIQNEEIVQYVPNYGIVVTTFTHEDVYEIYQIRTALDILATTNAMRLMTPEREAAMETLLTETEAAQAVGDVEKVIAMSKEFNTMIYRFAEMPRLETIQNRLRDYIIRFRDISLKADSRRAKALHEHRLIFRCLKNNDVEQVQMVITEHLLESRDFILLEMDRQLQYEKK
ncbi:GntR family transcriptional regulator [Erysipelothrix rhusiopathiae]|uniref:Transcriptional regulator, GntR family n=2 Tax=Erysipelothrix TaxID=1647 RepID=E7FUM9_ERYRH|nr:GntR family transcriptional regulator [Erysipelothrix rhusiopathiae]CAH2762217.1 GntR family transcriptional regulator [Erysipelothrix sp. A18Y020d]AGN23947.1 GntR family transcriptional regulator [Erysipelothrix rhusiopathiae SY1027]AMS11262.1 GntR family transcriptional regulator [Erysipelothrix rhusiopathiae]AOO67760.1 GntR family transcriptional regulator [Erysipelothrix rhusiopathiae]AWU41382.1 GntR family transcriptional regulator [Erysipelothrix rhusiopathiae]